VQLAQTIEVQHGQDSADAAVAQVGTDVGGQMEEGFRLAMAITGRMTSEQIGRCYVRLKHAIDGGFRVLEATPERIVLVNDRCPFGTAVQQAPSLCRMTSSVFGGIAARNSDRGASVLLEERIAVGDPGCRVIVDLNVPATAAAPEAHHYASPLS
jgi:predicted ArsR family transcriptional regulator